MPDSSLPYIDLTDTTNYVDDFISLGDTYVGTSAQIQSIPYQGQSTWAGIAGLAASLGGTVSGIYNSISRGIPYSPTGAVPHPLSATATVGTSSGGLLLVGVVALLIFLLMKKSG